MKSTLLLFALVAFSCSCHVMKKLDDEVHIRQRTPMGDSLPKLDSLLIVANGNSAMRQISEEIIPIFQKHLQSRGVQTSRVFHSYSEGRVNEQEFDNRNYSYTLWIYEQDRRGQMMEDKPHLVPFAIKLTNNQNSSNIWIATSVINSMVTKKFYKERYAGILTLLFRANGLVR